MTLQDQPNARGFESMSITRNRITISSLQEAPGIRKTFNVNIEENVFVFLLRLYICIYLIVLTTTMMRHFIVSPNPRKMKCVKIFLLHQLYIFMKTHNDQQMTEVNFITSTSCYHQQIWKWTCHHFNPRHHHHNHCMKTLAKPEQEHHPILAKPLVN